jgi:predicted O-methyltransferase YrrM
MPVFDNSSADQRETFPARMVQREGETVSICEKTHSATAPTSATGFDSGLLGKLQFHLGAWAAVLGHTLVYPFRATRARRHRLIAARGLLRGELPLVRIETVVGPDFPDTVLVQLRAVSHRFHNCTIFELLVLALVAQVVRPRKCFEFGTYDGRSALALATNVSADCEVYTLNLPPDYLEDHPELANVVDVQLSAKVESGARFRGFPEARRIHQLFGNSRTFDFSPYRSVQVIFIDGGHDDDTVLSDTRNALDMVDRDDGAILWHDATEYGVGRLLRKLSAAGHQIHLISGTEMGLLRFVNGREMAFHD